MGTNPLEPGRVFTAKPCGPVEFLRVIGEGERFELAKLPNPFAIGRVAKADERPRADVQLRSDRVSLIHGEVERRGDWLWYVDKGSTNGSYLHNERVTDSLPLVRGSVFRVADVSLIALDALQERLRPRLAWTLGLDAHAVVDHSLARIAADDPLLVVGQRGDEAEQLARTIHETSGRRDYPFRVFTGKVLRESEAELAAAKWGTVFVDLRSVGKVTAAFAEIIAGRRRPELSLRPIIAVPSVTACHRLLGELVAEQSISVPPLADRRGEIPRLIDVAMADAGARCSTQALGAARVASLTRPAFAKAQTLEGLRVVAERVRAVLETESEEAAAARLGITRQALNAYLHRLFDE